MRGSPILRTLIVLVLLALTGLGLGKLTASREESSPAVAVGDAAPPPPPAASPRASARYELALSAEAEKIELEAGGAVQTGSEGDLEIDPQNPLIQLRVTWAAPAAVGRRFAKLTLDLPGRESQSHTFDASGDIDDIWELK